MKIAIFADMHGDMNGLKLALDDIKKEQCSMTYCLGDMIDKKTETTEVIDYMRTLDIPIALGNHEFDLQDICDDDTIDFLNSLQENFTHDDAHLTHISPLDENKIRNADDALKVFQGTDHKHTFVAHNHFPYVFGYGDDGIVIDYDHPFEQELSLKDDERYIICVGALGDRRKPPVPKQYTIYDSVNHTVRFKLL